MSETPTAYASGTITPVVSNRSVADAVTNGTTLITSATAAFVSGDIGRIVTGTTDLGVFNYIAAVPSGTNATLAAAETGSHSGQTLNLTQEYLLKNVSSPGVFMLQVDLAAMAAQDVVSIQIYDAVLTGGTPRGAYPPARFGDLQPAKDLIYRSPVMDNDLTDLFGIVFTLTQEKGTARAFPWKVVQF